MLTFLLLLNNNNFLNSFNKKKIIVKILKWINNEPNKIIKIDFGKNSKYIYILLKLKINLFKFINQLSDLVMFINLKYN